MCFFWIPSVNPKLVPVIQGEYFHIVRYFFVFSITFYRMFSVSIEISHNMKIHPQDSYYSLGLALYTSASLESQYFWHMWVCCECKWHRIVWHGEEWRRPMFRSGRPGAEKEKESVWMLYWKYSWMYSTYHTYVLIPEFMYLP
jgi:hypothetical protein